jgi:mRNA-degrading endonuclease RelE of RelBE toxin-antitoxin system
MLTNQGGLRRSHVGGWRIIFAVDEEGRTVDVVTIERRGQVYHRI